MRFKINLIFVFKNKADMYMLDYDWHRFLRNAHNGMVIKKNFNFTIWSLIIYIKPARAFQNNWGKTNIKRQKTPIRTQTNPTMVYNYLDNRPRDPDIGIPVYACIIQLHSKFNLIFVWKM